MKEKTDKHDVGVIVGRFQIHELHDAHKDLINTVRKAHDRVIVFLGVSPLRNTLNNPLDFRARRTMFSEQFPDVEVHYIKDNIDDTEWSKNLDRMISDLLLPTQNCVFYGSRDSFLNRYHGKFPTIELESTAFISGTEVRRKVANNYPATKDYRAGLIAATANRYPTAYQTVDVAVVNDKNEVLLGRKPDEKQYRFIGGFSSPTSDSLEDDAKREVMEESGVEINDIQYQFSTKIPDWRFRGETDCIKTAFFTAKYVFGKPEGNDDIAEVRWFKIDNINLNDIVDFHKVLMTRFLEITKK